MTIIIEDGGGLTNAVSYASAADADSYFAARGITTWADLSTNEKEQSLVRATDFMATYSWKGTRTSATQSLSWPRQDVTAFGETVADDDIPVNVKKACMELAWRAAAGPLAPDYRPNEQDGGRFVTKKVEQVGPIDVETTYASRGQMSAPSQPVWNAINTLLREYVASGGGYYR